MKKIFILLFLFTNLIVYGQNNYYKILVKEKTTYQLDTLNQFLVVIDKVKIDDLKKLKSIYILSFYKDTISYNANRAYSIILNDIPNILEVPFLNETINNDTINNDMLYNAAYKLKLFFINKYKWNSENLILIK